VTHSHIRTRALRRSPLVREFLPSLLALGTALLLAAGSAQASSITISGTPPSTVKAGTLYSFTPTVKQVGGWTRNYVISGKPAWATFNGKTGTLLGTPTAANVGTYRYIVIRVEDGLNGATLPSFSITVQPGSSGGSSTVKISGTPPTTVAAGSPYSFKPTATDSAGRTLTYSVQNKPAWANFSISTGLLSGTPSASQAGTYPGIVISASDGQSSAALPSFNVSVTGATASGTATVTWTNPTQNTNGSALTNLAGVRLFYGPSASSLTQVAQITGNSVTSYTISNLAKGTWYFAAVAYTSGGAQSAMSSVVSKIVQ
jgi:Putative Ig domain